MLELLQFYVSGFWTWAGLTIGLAIIVQGLAILIEVLVTRGK